MKLSELIDNHENITLNDLGQSTCDGFLKLLKDSGVNVTVTPGTRLCELPEIFNQISPEDREKALNLELPDLTLGQGPGINRNLGSSHTPLTAQATALKSIVGAPARENNGRIYIGALFCIIMAFSILVFTSTIAVVSIKRTEFPPTGLCGIIVVAAGYIAWFYMGIINKERRDILTALVGTKIDSGVIANIIGLIKTRRQP